MMNRTLILSLSVVAMLGCDDTSDAPADGGSIDASSQIDAHVPSSDAGSDAGDGDACIPATLESFRLVGADDVSIAYRARIVPNVDEQPWDLYFEVNRYATEYVGEFPLGPGPDENYGGCARCVVAFYGTTRDHGFFAREGTLELRQDPFSYRLDATLRDVVLEEVTIEGFALESVPVPDGICIALATTTVTQAFAPSDWTCPAEQYGDGEACHCDCGAFDSDCGDRCPFPPDPSCDSTPLPVAGCETGEFCTTEHNTCAARCDQVSREGCASGYCGFSIDGDRCFDSTSEPASPAAVGETCAPAERIYNCAVDDAGFARGLCDVDAGWACRAVCTSDADCTTPGETCSFQYGDPDAGTARGFCAEPPPPYTPSGETCSEHLDCCTVLCEDPGVCA